MALEEVLENGFYKWCNERKIVAIKGPTATSRGFPDRFVQLPHGGGTIYVEFKGSSYYDLTPMQRWWQAYLLLSHPLRYFKVETKEELEVLKQRCLDLIEIGPKLVAYEKELLDALPSHAIMKDKEGT